MAVKIRLARGGSKKKPYYRVVVADERAPRDGRFIDRVGSYNPCLPKENDDRVVLDKEKIQDWLAKGAQPTEKVTNFIVKAGISLPASIQRKVEIRKKAQTIKPPKKEKKAS